MAQVIWSGDVDARTYRVVDRGNTVPARLTVEILGAADAMGVPAWNRVEPIPTLVFEGILESAGIIS